MTNKADVRIPIRFRTDEQKYNYEFLRMYLDSQGESMNARINRLITKEVKRIRKVKKC